MLNGIFTSTDILKLIVLSGLNHDQLSLPEFMTSNPDCPSSVVIILEALQHMHLCFFRHLLVADDHYRVIFGLVDVLQLASFTLFDLKSVAHKRSACNSSRYKRHTTSFSSWIPGNMGVLYLVDTPLGGLSSLGSCIEVVFGGIFKYFGQRDARNAYHGVAGWPY